MFNYFKELTHERLVKAYLFQCINHPSTSSWIRILDDIPHKCYSEQAYFGSINLDMPSCFIVYNTFSHFTMLYCNIVLQMRFRCYMANIALIFPLMFPRKVL